MKGLAALVVLFISLNCFGICFGVTVAPTIFTAPVTSQGWATSSAYLVQVTFGKPGQTLPLMLDSGSGPLQVAGAPFAAALGNTITGFDTTKSYTWMAASWIPPSQLNYGSASLACTFGYDAIALGNFKVKSTAIAITTQCLYGNPPNGHSGVLGMAWQDYTKPCPSSWPSCVIPAIISAAVAGGSMPVWTVYLTAASNLTTGGLNIGTIDSSQYTGSITYTPLTPDGITHTKWYVSMNQISVNGNPVACQNGGCYVLPDTGTSASIIFPSTAIATAVAQALGATQSCTLDSCQDSDTVWNANNWGWPCGASLASLPSFSLDFNGGSIVVPPAVYLGAKQIVKTDGWCSLGSGIFSMHPNTNNQITAGKPVIQRYYNVFDVGNARYGFAPVVGLPSNLAG